MIIMLLLFIFIWFIVVCTVRCSCWILQIYDEDDADEQADDSRDVSPLRWREEGVDGSGDGVRVPIAFQMRGSADLDEVCDVLGLQLDETERGEYSTVGGLVCAEAGEIPKAGDHIDLGNYRFTITEVEDNRRIINLVAEVLDLQAASSGAGEISVAANPNPSTNSDVAVPVPEAR